MTASPGILFLKILTGLRGCCRALALSVILLSSELSEEDGRYEVGYRDALKPEGQVCWREPVLLLERHSSAEGGSRPRSSFTSTLHLQGLKAIFQMTKFREFESFKGEQ